jgi:prepilin-type N-terminal cleavage/methylation domain-containing protein/prepilin-type processing-associated H-X9-DG protein
MRLRKPNGFTLVELLVVLGIVTILIALLLPTLSSAREQSKSLQCLSNLRQLGAAAHNYIVLNDGHFPIAYWGADSWDFAAGGKPGLLWMGRTDVRIQQCPSFDGRSMTLADPFTGYNYNTSYIGHGQFEAIVAPAKANQVRDPSRTALFGDGQYASGANKYMRSPFTWAGDTAKTLRHAGTQGFRHRKKTNVCFCDGHAEPLAQRFTTTVTAAEEAQVAPGTGFLSADNSLYDLK